jgi:uncharacterized protein YciI
MSELLLRPEHAREHLQAVFSDEANPIGLDGIEFVEYATARPQALGQVLEMAGFRPVARHRSREVLLYRQGGLNVIVNAHGDAAAGAGESPFLAAVALRVRDARSAHRYAVERDAPDQRELRERLRPAHRAWLREHPGHAVTVVHGGQTVDAQGTMNGTLLIVDAGSEAEACAFVAADPYVVNGLFAQLTVRR